MIMVKRLLEYNNIYEDEMEPACYGLSNIDKDFP